MPGSSNMPHGRFWTASKRAWRVLLTLSLTSHNGSRHGDLVKRSQSETFNLPKIWFDLYQLFQLAECNINWIILKSLLRTNAAAQNFQSTGQQSKTIPFHGASFNCFPFQFLRIMSRFPLLTHQLATAPSFAPGNRGTPPGWSSWSTWDPKGAGA